MLETTARGPVTRFRLGHEIMGQVHYWTSCFLLDGLLIDTGPAHTAAELLEAVRPLGVELIVNTHHHEDHVGGNTLLARELGVPVMAPEASLPALAQPPSIQAHRQMVWGVPQPFTAQPLPDSFSAGGRSYQVLAAPGHCADQAFLWLEDEAWVFCGDAFVAEAPRTAQPPENYAQAMDTLRRMAGLEPATLFSSPAGWVEPAAPALERTLAYLKEMDDRIRGLAAKGMSPEEIVMEIWGRESRLKEFTQGDFSYQNFVEAFLK